MVRCDQCGVELAEGTERCPLCGAVLGDKDAASRAGTPGPVPVPADGADENRQRRQVVAEVLSVSLAIAALTLVVLDLIMGAGIAWSLYPLVALGFIWWLICPTLMATRKPALGIAVSALAPFGFLVALDAINGSLAWSLTLGAPIAAAVELGVLGTILAAKASKIRGLNVLAYAFVAAAAICLVVEGAIDLYRDGILNLFWSSITASTLIPVAGFLFYAHLRLARNTTLKKLFHY